MDGSRLGMTLDMIPEVSESTKVVREENFSEFTPNRWEWRGTADSGAAPSQHIVSAKRSVMSWLGSRRTLCIDWVAILS